MAMHKRFPCTEEMAASYALRVLFFPGSDQFFLAADSDGFSASIPLNAEALADLKCQIENALAHRDHTNHVGAG